jgi:predicted RND superfamily exporter protein
MLSYAKFIIRYRLWVITLAVIVSAVLGGFGAGLKIVIDPDTLAPQGHPYILATKQVEKTFGSKYLMVIGITPKTGDIFQPAVLERVRRITERLEQSPGVVKATLMSLAARQARAIEGNADGFEAKPLLGQAPLTPERMQGLRAALQANPVYRNTVVSGDSRTAAILVELKERSDGFANMVAPVQDIVAAEAGPDVDITLGGNPVYLAKTEVYAQRINLLFPIAILVIGLLHFEAFRTFQGLILPLVTALMAVMWGTGFMGVLHQPLDIFNSPTPILILAVAAGHAVQILKRYYEEYEVLRAGNTLSPREANREAVIRSLVAVGPVMMVAGTVASLGFFSLLVFNIPTIRTFALFTGVGILSAVVLEMTFIPAMRSLLRAPSDAARRKESAVRIWDRIPRRIADMVIPAHNRRFIYLGLLAFFVLTVFGMSRIVVDNSSKNFFASWLQIQRDDDMLNRQIGGTNSLYIMISSPTEDAMKDPAVLQGLERIQRFADSQPYVGKTISLVDYLKRMNQAMNGDNPAFDRLPDNRNLIAQYLFVYALSGQPEDFDSYVDNGYRATKLTILLKTGSNAYIKDLVGRLESYAAAQFGPDITVRFGGDVTQTIALTDTMVHGKILNIIQICCAVFGISALAFGSLIAGLIVLAPLLLAVCAVFCVMGLAGIPLNIPNSLIAAMAVGIGADYAIYLLFRMREEIGRAGNEEDGIRTAIGTAGKACLFVSAAVAGGYGVLMLSVGYNVHLWLGMFIMLAMIVSSFGSLILVPSLVLSLRPRFIFRPSSRGGFVRIVAQSAVLLALLGAGVSARAENLSPSDIMERSLAATRVRDSIADATFTLVNKDGDQRVRHTEGYTKLEPDGANNMRMVRFLSPPDINGTGVLLIEHAGGDDDMWIYLPAMRKVRRLNASNKKDSFVGTDFSYGDVIGHKTADWTHRLLREEAVDGVSCYVIESLPKAADIGANAGYSRRQSWVRKDNFIAVRTDFWDLGGQPLKRITAGHIQAVGANMKWQPMLSTAENLQTGHKTTISFEQFKADQNVRDDVFMPRSLER